MKRATTVFEHNFEQFNYSYLITESEVGATNLKKHVHPYYEMLFVEEGEIEYVVENRRYVIKKGDVMLLKPGDYHFPRYTFSSPYKRFCIGFSADFTSDKNMPEKVFSRGEKFSLAEDSLLWRLVYILHERLKNGQSYHGVFCKSIVDALLVCLEDESPNFQTLKYPSEDNFQKIISYINKNITSIHSVKDISGALFLSESYIMHLFKSELRVGVMQYVRNKRVLLAHHMISKGRKPTELYAECGFANYTTFYRAYRAYFGVSPKKKAR